MKISYNWVKEYLNTNLDVDAASELLTDLGLEVEGTASYQSVKGGMEGLVIGEVLTKEQHPNADRLSVTTVNLGEQETVQIVCGAPNVAAGQKVVVATVGTELYDAEGNGFKIKKGKIRGEASLGMICASDEIGLGGNHDGIMVLPDELIPGTKASDYFKIENDTVIEIGLTPNRADAMGHFGVARDLKAGLIQQGESVVLTQVSVDHYAKDNGDLHIAVEVENATLCPRYAGVSLTNITVADSPEWLQNRLKAIGLNPINNIVDITNYVLHETGNPLHAFDAEKISGKKVVVKTVAANTDFITLDDEARKLDKDDLMICNANEPMCIAGVFGGADSGVTANTTSIFLEAAYFNPVSVRKTAKRHGLNTDASFRFERGIDPNTVVYALKRAALLMKELAGAKISSDISDDYPVKIEDFEVDFNIDNCHRLIGKEIPSAEIKSILESLEMEVLSENGSQLKLRVPAYRVDVQREVDVIEDVLRVYGYNNIELPGRIDAAVENTSGINPETIRNMVSDLLVSNGYYEAMNNSLTKSSYTTHLSQLKDEHNVILLNPLSQDLNAMRQSLLFGGLESIAYNINRKNTDIRLFEFGSTYHKYSDDAYTEKQCLAMFVSGNKARQTWTGGVEASDFFYAKGLLEMLLRRLGLFNASKQTASKNDIYAEGIVFKIGKRKIADIGLVRKSLLKVFNIKQDVCYVDLDWDAVLELIANKKTIYKEVPKFPAVRRDLALLLDESVDFAALEELAYQSDKRLLKEVNLFDVYQGDKLEAGKKSYAMSFMFQDPEKTLTDKLVDKNILKIFKTYQAKLNVELRDGELKGL